MTVYDTEKMLEKIGIEKQVIKSGKYKDMFQDSLSEKEKEILQNVSDEAYSQFVSDVAQGRNIDKEKVKELATGQIYTGSQAQKLGLVDRLGGIEEAVDYVSEIGNLKNPVRYEYPAPGLIQRMTGFTYKILTYAKNTWLPEELLVWRKIKNNSPYQFRYQVK